MCVHGIYDTPSPRAAQVSWPEFLAWAFPGTIIAFAIVLWGVARWSVGRFETRMDRTDERIDWLVSAVNKDLRYMGERMIRVETFLKLPAHPPPVIHDWNETPPPRS